MGHVHCSTGKVAVIRVISEEVVLISSLLMATWKEMSRIWTNSIKSYGNRWKVEIKPLIICKIVYKLCCWKKVGLESECKCLTYLALGFDRIIPLSDYFPMPLRTSVNSALMLSSVTFDSTDNSWKRVAVGPVELPTRQLFSIRGICMGRSRKIKSDCNLTMLRSVTAAW